MINKNPWILILTIHHYFSFVSSRDSILIVDNESHDDYLKTLLVDPVLMFDMNAVTQSILSKMPYVVMHSNSNENLLSFIERTKESLASLRSLKVIGDVKVIQIVDAMKMHGKLPHNLIFDVRNQVMVIKNESSTFETKTHLKVSTFHYPPFVILINGEVLGGVEVNLVKTVAQLLKLETDLSMFLNLK